MDHKIKENEKTEREKKKIILSGIQPTGIFTLGNYIGAVRQWGKLQNECDCIYMIADMHSITVTIEPSVLRQGTLRAYALLLAFGLDPEKSLLFIQSHVKTHAELAWVLSCSTQFGELSRMTQFKDKSAKNADNINAGLFTYPVLQAADILLYQPDYVPIGIDQKQHVELARDIAGRFNSKYGNIFKLPEPMIPQMGAKIMSLTEPLRKMSKSDENINSCIFVLDSKDEIIKKFKRAVTDSETEVLYREGKDGINNLMTIYSVVTGKSYEQIENDFSGKGYGDFKVCVGETVADFLNPVRESYNSLMDDKAYLEKCYKEGAQKALKYSSRTMDKVYKKIGFLK